MTLTSLKNFTNQYSVKAKAVTPEQGPRMKQVSVASGASAARFQVTATITAKNMVRQWPRSCPFPVAPDLQDGRFPNNRTTITALTTFRDEHVKDILRGAAIVMNLGDVSPSTRNDLCKLNQIKPNTQRPRSSGRLSSTPCKNCEVCRNVWIAVGEFAAPSNQMPHDKLVQQCGTCHDWLQETPPKIPWKIESERHHPRMAAQCETAKICQK